MLRDSLISKWHLQRNAQSKTQSYKVFPDTYKSPFACNLWPSEHRILVQNEVESMELKNKLFWKQRRCTEHCPSWEGFYSTPDPQLFVTGLKSQKELEIFPNPNHFMKNVKNLCWFWVPVMAQECQTAKSHPEFPPQRFLVGAKDG